jgi:rsbT co-antagonist protein RsbR
MPAIQQTLGVFLEGNEQKFVGDWVAEATASSGTGASSTAGATAEARALSQLIRQGLREGGEASAIGATAWKPVLDQLGKLSASRAAQGASAADTSVFVLSMKKPFFDAIQSAHGNDAAQLGQSMWWVSTLVDKFAQHTITTYQQSRERVITRQQEELLELSTPVVKLWEGVLAVPMIGTLDSARTQMVMEALLQALIDTEAEIAIIDITGVPTVDTLVAQHLLKTVTAIRLMGAECIISGIRPQIAQTIVHLGIDLQNVVTKATLADALKLAMKQIGFTTTRVKD